MPIRCSGDLAAMIGDTLGCTIRSFPCMYLGLLLGIRKLSDAQLVDQLANKLPKCHGAMMPKNGRLLLLQMVLCAIPMHAMMALDFQLKTIAAMNKICRGVLWCAKSEANGGSCAVAWEQAVCVPRWMGGLGIVKLRWLNIAMLARWVWLLRSD